MKLVKLLIIAASAAMMTLALVGVSSAMAESTKLCTQDPSGGTCTAPTHLHEVTTESAILETSIVTFECDALFLSTSVGAPGAPQVIEGKFTYSNCTNNCTAVEEKTPSTIKVLKVTGHETAEITGEGEVHVNCSGLNCYYNGKGLEGSALGPLLAAAANGEINLVEKEVKKSKGLFCPTSSFLTIHTSPLSATYIGMTMYDLVTPNGVMRCIGADDGSYKKRIDDEKCSEPL